MKTKYITTIILPMLALCAAGFTACEEDSIPLAVGDLLDDSDYNSIAGSLRSKLSFSGETGIVLLTGDGTETKLMDELFYELNRPIDKDLEVTLSLGQDLTDAFMAEVNRLNTQVEAYRKLFPLTPLYEAALLPDDNITLSEKTLTIHKGKSISETIECAVSTDNLDLNTLYLLTINMELSTQNSPNVPNKNILQYFINLRPNIRSWENTIDPSVEISLDTEFYTVFYVNTERYQPLIADVFLYGKTSLLTWETEKVCSFGNLVNLRQSTVSYAPSSGRSLLLLDSDLRYVLEHADKYIRPLQNRGRKVCLCIQGGGKGIGFCNMTDTQIADFTSQVKEVVELYKLDGINLWDEGSGYGKEGMPPMNTTSYPKLIKSLREAMPDKLLTLVDKEGPTEYFHDVSLCGGIEVGKYIDYAWHGYFSYDEITQIIEPWETESPYSDYKRKPIAGLTPEKYGSVNIARQPGGDLILSGQRRVMKWKSEGRKKNNMIVFGFDLSANEQDGAYEGHPLFSAFEYLNYFSDDGWVPQENPFTGEIEEGEGNAFYMLSPNDESYRRGFKFFWKDW